MRPGALWAILTIAIQVVGSFIILSGRLIWLGAGMLGGFTVTTTVIAHRFWDLSGQSAFQARNEFFEHYGLVAGFVMVAMIAKDRNRNQSFRKCGLDPHDY